VTILLNADSSLALPALEIPLISVEDVVSSPVGTSIIATFEDINDDLSEASRKTMNEKSDGPFLESGVSMQVANKQVMQEKMLSEVKSKPATAIITDRNSTGRSSTGKSTANPYDVVIPPV
jgi:hypothetical protein